MHRSVVPALALEASFPSFPSFPRSLVPSFPRSPRSRGGDSLDHRGLSPMHRSMVPALALEAFLSPFPPRADFNRLSRPNRLSD